MTTNIPSSAYKPLHEYRILRVSNSPHLCELCTTLLIVAQHIPLYTVSSFTKRPACLEHRQVWLLTSSRSSNSAIPIFMYYAFFFLAYLSSWCLSREGFVIPLNVNHGCSLLWATPPTSQCLFPQTVVRAGCPPRSPARSPTFAWQVFLYVLVPL
ncbi:hypothetical protein BHE74_00020609 [Ensete ventricosum]|nr:hypothetical protein BHE74_00020609 [Ensete ventricosum]RZR97779.1 hypothetical protein BHM03_00027028 [Ensete ventricosum]